MNCLSSTVGSELRCFFTLANIENAISKLLILDNAFEEFIKTVGNQKLLRLHKIITTGTRNNDFCMNNFTFINLLIWIKTYCVRNFLFNINLYELITHIKNLWKLY